jgi:hypothetical protein
MNLVNAYHGTTKSRAEKILSGQFRRPNRTKPFYWLGRGIYFFQDNPHLALKWAKRTAESRGEEPAVLHAQIDLTGCMDIAFDPRWHELLGEAHNRLRKSGGALACLDQTPLRILDDQVLVRGRSGPSDGEDTTTAGLNYLDYVVLEFAIEALKAQGVVIESVRALFLEGQAVYPNSWVYDQAHLAIAVRHEFQKQRIRSIAPYEESLSTAPAALEAFKALDRRESD